MSEGGKVFLVILLLPFLAALAHDVYFSYFMDEEKIKKVEKLQVDPEDFAVSDLGWIWNYYLPDSLKSAREAVEPEIWKEKVDPILQAPTMLVGGTPFIIGFIYCTFAFILGVWPYEGRAGRLSGSDHAAYRHAKRKSTKYSRK